MAETISIVIPAYNIETYIEKTVESVQAQTYTDLEIILVDDGSSDGTPQILDQLALKDSRIKVIHKPNGGVTSARLEGVRAAAGEWIGFVDGDDYIEPDMYERLLSNAHKHHAMISHCGYQMVFPSRVDYYYKTGRLVEQDHLTGLRDLLTGDFIEPGLVIKLYRHSLFQSILDDNKMDASIRNTEDLLMNFYLFNEAEKSVYEDICPYHYMLRKGSAATSSVNAHKLKDPLKVLRILDEETKAVPDLNQIVQRRIVGCLIGQATMSLKEAPELIKPVRDDARKELRRMDPEIQKGDFSKKQKLFARWVCLFPDSYRWVHILYAKLRGTDKKYEVK